MNKPIRSLSISLSVLALAFAVSGRAHEHEEENSAVGPDKGITAYEEDKGFKLSPEAEKTFEITTSAFSGGSISLPKSAVFRGLEVTNLFRVRDGFYRRIDFKTLSKTADRIVVSSPDLASGDRVVLTGVGFLRIVELQAGGGIEDHH